MLEEHQPKCELDGADNRTDCTARQIWRDLYADFAKRRKVDASQLSGLQVFEGRLTGNRRSAMSTYQPMSEELDRNRL